MLSQVLDKNLQLEDILSEHLKGLSNRDRALARALTSSCLRHLGVIDYLIDKMLDRPLPKGATNVKNVVRIGLTQVLFMEIPPHAAVHDTVELIPDNSKFKGLVNALLRRADRQGKKLLDNMNKAHRNTPDWLWRSWKSFYGEEIATAIANANMIEAPLDISVKSDPEERAISAVQPVVRSLHLKALKKAIGGSKILQQVCLLNYSATLLALQFSMFALHQAEKRHSLQLVERLLLRLIALARVWIV